MDSATLLIEIGCEEIPARMIQDAATDLERRVVAILDQAGLSHGASVHWGGSRRLAVRVDAVQARQKDRDEQLLGPPAAVAFDGDGKPTRAAIGFAKKQGVDASVLSRVETERGAYAGLERKVTGEGVGAVLAQQLPKATQEMWFPKTMRWGNGTHRWVRPVHWVLALHGKTALSLSLFGVDAGSDSCGHRFKSQGAVRVSEPERYAAALLEASVVVEPEERRRRLADALHAGAAAAGGVLLDDVALLEEVADLVEWPGVVTGEFSTDYLELPAELLVTTLRHHQKCFSVRDGEGQPRPFFLAVTNSAEDPAGHMRRGNEWVVGGRLEDARFFWREDRKRELASRFEDLERVVFHARGGSYAEKAERMQRLAGELSERIGASSAARKAAGEAARLAKVDLVTHLVGEFPELQGVIGGILLRAEGGDETVAQAIYEHYKPEGPEDPIPESDTGAVVALADKLDSVATLDRAGERAKGSRDPFGMRRAGNGIVRIIVEREWPLSLGGLAELGGGEATLREFLRERLVAYLKFCGFSSNEILAVFRPRVDRDEVLAWTLSDVVLRLEAIKLVRGREDFRSLVKLTERVDNILVKNAETVAALPDEGASEWTEDAASALALRRLIGEVSEKMKASSARRGYDEMVEMLSQFIQPVEQFFDDVLVIDPDQPQSTHSRFDLLTHLNELTTRYFDIRELAGQAERSN